MIVLKVEAEFYPVTGSAQAQPGEAGGRLLTSLQVDNFGSLKLKVKNTIMRDLVTHTVK